MHTPDPPALPPKTGRQITDYSADPTFAKRLPDAPPGTSVADRVLARLERKA
jgi:hypothetical protein